jgi:hypothetical protein
MKYHAQKRPKIALVVELGAVHKQRRQLGGGEG